MDIIAYVLPGDLNNTKPPVTIVSFLKIYLRPELLTDEQRIQILHDIMRKFCFERKLNSIRFVSIRAFASKF